MLAHAALATVLALATTLPLAWKWDLGVGRVGATVAAFSAIAALLLGTSGAAAAMPAAAAVAAVWSCTLLLAVSALAYRFYRDPDRTAPNGEATVVSPAEGKVVYVRESRAGTLPVSTKHGRPYRLRELTKTPLRSADATVIGISMSFLDVHVNRAPVSGRVTLREHFPGTFGSLRRPEMVFDNERATTVVDRGDIEVAVVQIASRLVRQIVSFVAVGDHVAIGQRMGVIRFGSQVDVVLPARHDLHVAVYEGARVRAGETVLAHLPPTTSTPASARADAEVEGARPVSVSQEPETASGLRVDAHPPVGHVMRAYLARTETFVYNQMTSLRRYRPVVAAHHRRPHVDFPLERGAIAEEQLPGGLSRLERLAYRTLRTALPPANAVLAEKLREERVRLLHYHYVTDARFLLGVERRTGLPSIVSAYGYDVSEFPRMGLGLGRRYLRPAFDRLDCFLAMSEDMRDDLLALGCREDKIDVHYYGSDTRRFRVPGRSYEPPGPATVFCCARLEEAKGIHLVLAALRRIERSVPVDFRVVIAGEGSMRDKLEQKVAEYGWEQRVVFTGHVPHTSGALVDLFRSADVFAHPSITVNGLKEGIPGTIVEAMAAGLPVVATHHAGIPAVIESGTHGLLVDEYDVDALAAALEALLRDEKLRAQLGQGAAARAAGELDLTARTRHLERIYDRFL